MTTVKELIKKLQALENQDARIVVSGYEGGLSDVHDFESIDIYLNVHSAWYYGNHKEKSDSFLDRYQDAEEAKAYRLT